MPVPDAIKNIPELRPGLKIYLDAFFDLESERDVGFAPGQIKWSSIARYAKFYEFDKHQSESLFYIIRRLDAAQLKRVRDAEKST